MGVLSHFANIGNYFFQNHISEYLARNLKIWYDFIDVSVFLNYDKRIDIACYLQWVKYEERMQ